jgi:DNA-binding FrmR family transcriptional regulator
MAEIPERIIERIRKLLDMQYGAEKIGSLHEAENAAARIQEILFKYNADLSDIDLEKNENKISENQISIATQVKRIEGQWVSLLYNVIAKGNLCRAICHQVRGGEIFAVSLIGNRVNIEITQYTVEQLIPRIRIMAKRSWDHYNGGEKKNAYMRGFYKGAVHGINYKLEEQKKSMMQEQSISALVKREDAALENYINGNHQDLKTSKSNPLSAQDGLHRGFQAGKDIEINKGLKNGLNQNLLK